MNVSPEVLLIIIGAAITWYVGDETWKGLKWIYASALVPCGHFLGHLFAVLACVAILRGVSAAQSPSITQQLTRAVTPPKTSDGWAHVAIGAYAVTAFADVGSSEFAFGRNRQAYEANSALTWATSNPWGLGVLKGGIAVTEVELFLWLHRSHPRIAIMTAVAAAGLNGYAVAHNARLLSPER